MTYPNLSPELDRAFSGLAQRLDLNDRHEMLAALEHIAEACGDDPEPVAHLQDVRVPEKARRAVRQLQTENGLRPDALRPHQRPWIATDKYDHVLAAATATAHFAITSPDLAGVEKYRSELLDNVLWLMTVAPSGQYTTQYRSASAVAEARPTLRHEHVFTRKTIKADLLALRDQHPDELALRAAIGNLLRERAIGCTVTKADHDRLTPFDKAASGWDRYRQAGVPVIDMLTGDLHPPTLPPDEDSASN